MQTSGPPKLARSLLRLFLRGEEREVILGDLDEEYEADVLPRRGPTGAARWYWRQTLASLAWRRRAIGRSGVPSTANTSLMQEIAQDLRYAARTLRKSPGFTTVAVATLAIGIGANTAIFTVVDAVMLRPLPYDEPDRLVLLWNKSANTGSTRMPIAAPDVAEYRDEAELFEAFAFTDRIREAALTGGGGGSGSPQHITLARVTANFFSVLGVPVHAGRPFLPNEGFISIEVRNDSTVSISPNAVILSHGIWQRRFGGSPDVIGTTIEVSGQPTTVVGVLPPNFELLLPPNAGFARNADAWTPLRVGLEEFQRPTRLRDRDSDNTGAVIARLAPGVALAQAQAEMDAIARRQRDRHAYHARAGLSIDVRYMHDDVIAHARQTLLFLFGAVAFVLLIACINVANLLLARATDRQKELALRAALGAGQGRITRQLLTESGLLALLGGAAGLVLSRWGITLLVAMRPANLPRISEIGIDASVMGFSLGATFLAALLVGVAPAFHASIRKEGELLQQRGAAAGRRSRLRAALVISEVALSLALLVGAGLMFRSLARLQRVDTGFEPEGTLAFDVTLRHPGEYRGPAARNEFIGQVEEMISSLPGVSSVGMVGRLPLGGRNWTQPYGLDGAPPEEWAGNEANFRVITAGYFTAMGTRLMSGRLFAAEDDRQDRRVVIVDKTMARRIAPDQNAVGRRIGFPLDGDAVWAEVVGVVENVSHENLRGSSRETLYVPYRHEASRDVSFVVRTSADPASLVGPIRRDISSLASHLPIYNVRTMSDYVRDSLGSERFTLILVGVFAVAAMVLASIGLYGVISYSVKQRTQEIGIRMALGARRGSVVGQVVSHGMMLAGAGLGIGVVVSLATSRLLSNLLFEVSPTDLPTYAGVSSILLAVALVACYAPARRASGVDPMTSLRRGEE